jgi:Arc/MetJ-type ribon-helix-helix transcriptional regulator
MSNKKKARENYGTVHWFNMNYWLLNGFMLPSEAYSDICHLVNQGRYSGVDEAIRAGIKTLLLQNARFLPEQSLGHLDKTFKHPAHEKPDKAGQYNVDLLEKMYASIQKANLA